MSIALLFGGKSCEHDISIITAAGLGGALPNAKKIYVDEQNKWWYVKKTLRPREYKAKKTLKNFLPITLLPNDTRAFLRLGGLLVPIFNIDCAVMAFHGVFGEDGSAQGLLEMAGIPYTGSGVAASAIGMDKMLSKMFFKSLSLPVANGEMVTLDGVIKGESIISEQLSFPLVVKPCSLGSSIGISLARDGIELEKAVYTAFGFDNRVVIENAVKNCHEANCSYLCGEVSDVYCPISSGEILSFADKYMNGEKAAPIRETRFTDEIKTATKLVCDSLGVKGVARLDFLVNQDGWFVNEINTIPGSLAYPIWSEKYSPREFAELLIADAKQNFQTKTNLTYAYESMVLSGGSSKK